MYFISIIIFLAVLVSTFLLSGSITIFIDLPSILIIIAITLPMLLSSGLFTDFKNSFRIVMSKDKTFSNEELERAILAIDLTNKLILISGFLGSIIGLISMLRQLSDPSKIGPSVAVMLLTTFYALFLTIILMPVKAKLKLLITHKNKS